MGSGRAARARVQVGAALGLAFIGLVATTTPACGGFGSDPEAPRPAASTSGSVSATVPAPDASALDAQGAVDGSSCAATGAGKFDPAYGAGGGRELPQSQALAALGPAGSLYVVGVETCGAGRGITVRKVPLDGSSAGVVVRCIDTTDPTELVGAFHGDPTSGYVLATRVQQGTYRARLRFLDPLGQERAPMVTAAPSTWAAFALRVQIPPESRDVWGLFTSIASIYSSPFVGAPQGRAVALSPGEMPVAAASHGATLVVAFVRNTDETSTYVVRRYVVDATGFAEDRSFGVQEVRGVGLLQPEAVRSVGMLHVDAAGAVLALGQGTSLFPVRLLPSGPRPLPPVVGFGSPHVTRRCDGSLAMAYLDNGGKVVVTRYVNDTPDPAYRATVTGGNLPAFMLRAPDESLLVGIPSGATTVLRRVLP